jgi:hypothetical protein
MAQFDEKTGERIYGAQTKPDEPKQVKPDELADKKNQPKAAEK